MPEISIVLDSVEKCAALVAAQSEGAAWGVLLLDRGLTLLEVATPDTPDQKPEDVIDRAACAVSDQGACYAVVFDRVNELEDFPSGRQLHRFLEIQDALRALGIALVDRLVVEAGGRYLSRRGSGAASPLRA